MLDRSAPVPAGLAKCRTPVVPLFGTRLLGFASVPALVMALAISTPAHAQSADEIAPAAAAPADDSAAAAAAPAEAAPAEAAAAAPAEAAAASSAPAQRLQNMTVTGSAIASPDAATAVPVTIYHTEELQKEGITSADQLLQRLGVNNSSGGQTSQNVTGAYSGGASFANLRGLGSDKTLVLLNGRRISANAYDGSAVDLNSIPFAALDRVEVLTDSASALYGSDAMAGVINFITKKNYQGAEVSTNQRTPTHSGGGQNQEYSFTWGTGDLEKDGFNWMGTLDYQNQHGQNHSRRLHYNTDYYPAYGTLRTPGVYHGNTQSGSAKYYQTGCRGVPTSRDGICGDPSWGWGNYLDPVQNTSLYTAASFKLDEHNTGELSYYWGHSHASMESYPDLVDLNMDPQNPNYPAATASNSDLDRSQPITAMWHSPLEQNRMGFGNDAKRLQYAQFGSFGGWHYDTAIAYNRSKARWRLNDGYINGVRLQDQVDSGEVNPLRAPTERELGLIRSDRYSGRIQDASGSTVDWDGHISHSLGDWFGAGPVQMAVGGEASHERLELRRYDTPVYSTGLSAEYAKASRDQQAIWTEVNIPILTSLEATASWRYDRFSQVGHTANPKFSFRYQPIKDLVFRGSYSTSFVAPNLYSMYEPESMTFSDSDLHDPLTCPTGSSGQDCDNQFHRRQGGNPNLKPMKAEVVQFGFVYSPVTHLTTSADFWWYRIRNDVRQPDDQYALDHAGPNDICRYGTACAGNATGANNTIYYFNNYPINVGKIHTNGVDLKANYLLPTASGDWLLSANFTHVFKYDTSRIDGGWDHGLGQMNPYDDVNFRWKGSATLGWNKGPWAAGLTGNYQSGYKDYQPGRNPEKFKRHEHVSHFATFDLNASYTMNNGLAITVGALNLFDRKPPYSDYNLYGVDSRYASALGRQLYTRLNYKF